ncbi:YciI family protein [Actinomadura soli]|uniref:YciI family protein n=1 Tax=Actinomadura soli TaxID=2508997 RepID=A0A5C4JD16_9ACTN|nr:YciI family protein [Actinomadura soli]TMR00405.1 YciI family protein [Actinomadura soli]
MRYMMLICGVESDEMPADVFAKLEADTGEWVEEMDGRGVRLFGHRLRPVDTATTVRTRDGETLLSDGPFAETKEQILGFDLIECADLEEALEVASGHPCAEAGTIEVRPLWEE